MRDELGGDLVNAASLGGLTYLTFGDRGAAYSDALDAGIVSNPDEPANSISRLAGNTQSEESVAWCGSNALVGFNDSGSFVRTLFPPSPSPSFSFSFNGWSLSTNAGGSFTDQGVLLPDPVPAGTRFLDLFGDPVLACTDSSTFYYASLATQTTTNFRPFSAITVSMSTDGGARFGGARIAVSKPAFTPFPAVAHSLDKPWMDTKRVGLADHIYVTYTDFSFGVCAPFTPGTAIELVRSIDGGATWSAPVLIDSVCGFGPFVQGSHVAAGLGSDLWVAWESFPNGLGTGRNIQIKKSTDDGLTFGAARTVSGVTAVGNGFFVQGLFRTFIDLQGLAVDLSDERTAGNVYVTWHDGRNANQTDPFAGAVFPSRVGCLGGFPRRYCFGDALLSRSTDGGATWSATPIRVNDDPITLKVDQLFPGVDVDKNGKVFVVFYDRRRDKRNFLIDTFIATSEDAGLTFENDGLTENNFAAIHAEDVVVNPAYMGDYLGISHDRTKEFGGVIGAWGDNSLGNPNVKATRTGTGE